GAVFVVGEDAPVSSVVGFNITINKITLNNSSTSVQALSTPTAVDFGRLMGLRSLLAFNTITPGTYNSATFTFENASPAPVIDYVDLSTNPPSVNTLTGSLTETTVTVPFPAGKPLVVGSNELAGLHIDFDLRDSLVVNGNLVSVNTNANSFVMQGPYGFQETIDVNSSTLYNGSNSLSTLVVNGIVCVTGTVQADGSILASGVELIGANQAFISGRVLAVNPASGPVQIVTMWVGEELGTSGIIPVDTVQTINLSAVSTYDVC